MKQNTRGFPKKSYINYRNRMYFLKAFFKLFRSWYTIQILLLLTAMLSILYFIQVSYLYSVKKINYERKEKLFLEVHNDAFPFRKDTFKKTFQGEKLVHIDLKGAPPKIDYLLSLIPFIKSLGATGLLIEYEDMFPYHDEIKEISALNSYTISDIEAIIQTAELNNLTVIPLIPTLGHFDFVLKLEKYKMYREIKNNPYILCPSEKKIYFVLQKMIDQVLEVHKTSKYLHIGCDEARYLGICPKCRNLLRRRIWRRDGIYFNHMRIVAQYIKKSYPGVQPIVWGDKFITQNEKLILSHRIPELVEVMLWNYKPDINFFPSDDDMKALGRLFKNIWIANAFKGATGSMKIVTIIDYHLRNSEEWMIFVDKWKDTINFKGLAITGWQRYGHFMPLCELLPVGIPSLALNLQYINPKQVFNQEKVKRSLNCTTMVPLNLNEIRDLTMLSNLKCNFPGFKVYYIVHSYFNALFQLLPNLAKLKSGDFSFYSIINKECNPAYVHELKLKSYEQQLLEINELEKELRITLEEIYDQDTITEWIMTYVMPVQMHLEAGFNILSGSSSRDSWPRRPQINGEFQARKYFNKICTKRENTGCAFFYIHSIFF